MSPITQTRESIGESKTHSGLPLKFPDGARILIVCDGRHLRHGSAEDRLLNPAGFTWSSRHPCWGMGHGSG